MEALQELSVCKHCERTASYKFSVYIVRLDPMAQSLVFAGVSSGPVRGIGSRCFVSQTAVEA